MVLVLETRTPIWLARPAEPGAFEVEGMDRSEVMSSARPVGKTFILTGNGSAEAVGRGLPRYPVQRRVTRLVTPNQQAALTIILFYLVQY